MIPTLIFIVIAILFVLLVLHLVNKYVLPPLVADAKARQIVLAIIALIAILVLAVVVWPKIAAL